LWRILYNKTNVLFAGLGKILTKVESSLKLRQKEDCTVESYFYDDDLAMVYKISPVAATVIKDEDQKIPTAILVHANVKVTNFKREKVRRTISEVYPYEQYDIDAAKEAFTNDVLLKVLGNATAISEEEYNAIKRRVEPISCCTN
jgi:hypothetical protein